MYDRFGIVWDRSSRVLQRRTQLQTPCDALFVSLIRLSPWGFTRHPDATAAVAVGFSRTGDGHNHRQGATSSTRRFIALRGILLGPRGPRVNVLICACNPTPMFRMWGFRLWALYEVLLKRWLGKANTAVCFPVQIPPYPRQHRHACHARVPAKLGTEPTQKRVWGDTSPRLRRQTGANRGKLSPRDSNRSPGHMAPLARAKTLHVTLPC